MKLWMTDDAWVDTRGDPWVVSWHGGHKLVAKGNVDDLVYKIGLAVADLLTDREAKQARARRMERDATTTVRVADGSGRPEHGSSTGPGAAA